MAKTKVSATELVWIFQERIQVYGECPIGTDVAIVSSEDGWMVATNARQRKRYPLCAKRIDKLQKELREVYVLAKD